MQAEQGLSKEIIRVISDVLSPAVEGGKDSNFSQLAKNCLRSQGQLARLQRSLPVLRAGYNNNIVALDGEARRLDSLEETVRDFTDGASEKDLVKGGADVIRGRLGVIAYRLGEKAPWWLKLFGIIPSPQHPLLEPVKIDEGNVRRARSNEVINLRGLDYRLTAQRNSADKSRADFFGHCNAVAATPLSESIAIQYLQLVPNQAADVAFKYAQNHGFKEEWLRFFPKMVDSIVRSPSRERRLLAVHLGILRDQIRPVNEQEIGETAKRMWVQYLADTLLEDWSKDNPAIKIG